MMQALYEKLSRVFFNIPFVRILFDWLVRNADLNFKDLLYEVHYGCPNSKRTERLQLKKRMYR